MTVFRDFPHQNVETEHHREWADLQAQAHEFLRRGTDREDLGISRWFQILILPSLTPSICWEIFERRGVSQALSHFALRA